MQPVMVMKRMARRGFELHVSTVRQIGEIDGYLQTAGVSVRPEQRGVSLAIALLGKEGSSRAMNTDDLGCFLRVQSGKLEKRKKMWGRLGCQAGTTSRAVPPAAGLTCGGARHATQPTRMLRGRGMWRLIAQLMNDKVFAPKG